MARKDHVVVVHVAGRAPASYGPYYRRDALVVSERVTGLLGSRGVEGFAVPCVVELFPLPACDGEQLELPLSMR